jgi:small subunit ribosomal protein S5
MKSNVNVREKEDFEKVIKIDRVTKVAGGGKRLAFRVLAISGDKSGRVGFGLAKSKEVPAAIRKAIERAKSHYIKVNMCNGTVPHEVIGEYGASKVIILPAKEGTGVIAGGSVRSFLEAAGFSNVVAKCFGSRNPYNAINAAINALLSTITPPKLRSK